MFLKTPFRRIFLFALIVSLALAFTACNRKDDGVAPSIAASPESSQGQQLFKPSLASIQSATGPVDVSEPTNIPTPDEVIASFQTFGIAPRIAAGVTPSIKASFAPNPSGPNLALYPLAIANASSYWPWALPYGPGGA